MTLKEKLVVNVLTVEGTIQRSENVYLHSVYNSEQDWFKWKDFYATGSFVSDEYLDEAESYSWRDFLVNVLDVKEKATREQIEDFAEHYVKHKLNEKGYRVLSEHGEGYDYELKRMDK